MKLDPEPFRMIRRGQKTIELRLNDEKRQRIRVGDGIIFASAATGEELRTRVMKLHRFSTFRELYQQLPLLQCGYTAENIAQAKSSDMARYYAPEDEKRYGVVGIELRLDEAAVEEGC